MGRLQKKKTGTKAKKKKQSESTPGGANFESDSGAKKVLSAVKMDIR